MPRAKKTTAISIASSHLITSCATLAAILMFVGLGSQVVPSALSGVALPHSANVLKAAFLLNIAIILFGWRRSKDLREALAAYELADTAARHNANTDLITGLSNRRDLIRCLTEVVETRQEATVLLLDLDHFKRVNDLHGHYVGDQLLREVGEVLTRAAPDAPCCARIGGDEFALVLAAVDAYAAEAVAEAILAKLRVPVDVAGIQTQASVSIGVATAQGCETAEDMLRHSDVALYAAKRLGRNCFAWFDEKLERELSERLRFEEDMRRGLEQGEFVPFFQPLMDLESRDLMGFEALARWRSPSRGLLEAESFIETAERTGLVGPLTLSILQQALEEAREWPEHLKLAVNISAVQLRDASLAERISEILRSKNFPGSRLEVEITEGSLLEDRDQVLETVGKLKKLGATISLDDFGTGYASLAQVQCLPIDRIKIDKSFINTIVKSEQTAAIVSTIASLGHTLHVPITAEGVESERIREALKVVGCSEAQGWLFGRAVSGETVRAFLKTDQTSTEAFGANTRRFRGPK